MTGVRRSLVPKATAALLLLLAFACTQVSHAAALRIVGRRGIRSIEAPSGTLDDRDVSKHIGSLESSFARQLRQDGGGTPRDGPTSKTRAHGYTAGISIGVLMPATAIIARNFREFAPAWFYLHAPLGIVALVAGIVGVILGSQLPDDIYNMTAYDAHKALGVLAVVAAGLQITALVLRPKPEHPKRYIFNHVHHNVGRLALACGIAATYLGLKATGEATKFYVGYSIVLAVLAAVWLAKEALDFVRIAMYNRRVRKAGFEAPSLPGGHPMNGGFAATFMQRRPPHGNGSDAEAALPHGDMTGTNGMRSVGGKPGFYDNSNPGSHAELLKAGNGFTGNSSANSSATSLHQPVSGSGGNRGAVEMQRR